VHVCSCIRLTGRFGYSESIQILRNLRSKHGPQGITVPTVRLWGLVTAGHTVDGRSQRIRAHGAVSFCRGRGYPSHLAGIADASRAPALPPNQWPRCSCRDFRHNPNAPAHRADTGCSAGSARDSSIPARYASKIDARPGPGRQSCLRNEAGQRRRSRRQLVVLQAICARTVRIMLARRSPMTLVMVFKLVPSEDEPMGSGDPLLEADRDIVDCVVFGVGREQGLEFGTVEAEEISLKTPPRQTPQPTPKSRVYARRPSRLRGV
jgi:hypothetical protein